MLLRDLFPKGEDPDPMAWVILASGVICIILFVWLYAQIAYAQAHDECNGYEDIACTTTVWELQVDGETVSLGDMDEDQCEAMKEEIEPQTKPFSRVECVAKEVIRFDTSFPVLGVPEGEKGGLSQ